MAKSNGEKMQPAPQNTGLGMGACVGAVAHHLLSPMHLAEDLNALKLFSHRTLGTGPLTFLRWFYRLRPLLRAHSED